jgi:hypothetical protein
MFASCKVAVLCTDTFCDGYMKNKLLLSRERQLRFMDAHRRLPQKAGHRVASSYSESTQWSERYSECLGLVLASRTEGFWSGLTVHTLLDANVTKSKSFSVELLQCLNNVLTVTNYSIPAKLHTITNSCSCLA